MQITNPYTNRPIMYPARWGRPGYNRVRPPTRTVQVNGVDYENLGVGQNTVVFTENNGEVIFPFGIKRPNYFLKGLDGKRYIINGCAYKKLGRYKALPKILHMRKDPDQDGWIINFKQVNLKELSPLDFIKIKTKLAELGINAKDLGIKGM